MNHMIIKWCVQEYLRNYGEDEKQEIDDNMVEVGSGFYLYKDLHAKLYQHQKEGVLWLWDLHTKNKGGILGDDMGWEWHYSNQWDALEWNYYRMMSAHKIALVIANI